MRFRRGAVGVVALALLVHVSPADSAAPARARGAREILAAKAARDSARAAWVRQRWSGTFAGLRAARARLDDASGRYRSILLEAEIPTTVPQRDRDAWTAVAMDLADQGAWPRALRLLSGPLGSPASLLPVQALAAGDAEPAAGLKVLAWPPDRARGGPGRARLDEAGLFVAATLADSAGLARASRTARWRLLSEGRTSTSRNWARASLVRSLVAGGEPLLAKEILARTTSRTSGETLLLADLTAASGDSIAAARLLVATAARGDLSTADRYAAARRASGWMQGAAADSLSEREWVGLLRSLADVGEPERALRVMDARRRPAPDPAAAQERGELKASLLYRAKRYEAAASAYRALALARRPSPKADLALGYARALRGVRRFESSDSAFVQAASLDSAGATREAAAWERAREWEDQKAPRDAAAILKWARTRVRTEPLASTVRVHEAVAWIRADSLARADSVLAEQGPEDARVFFWRGWVASARGDSARARAAYQRAWELDPWSYEGVRARELSGLKVEATQGFPQSRARHALRSTSPPPVPARVLYVVGFRDLSLETMRTCAMGESEAGANGCIDALEEEGIFRVGRANQELDLRLRFPPAFAGAVFRASDEESLSAPFIWSIMRLESAYNPTARSRAGALGLLQLIVPTASRLAGRSVSEDALVDPDLNVRLGAMYLRRLVREFGDLRPVAAAYNSGEEAVRRWITAHPRIDDLWVELIPYRETRDYVKQTYAAMRRYEAVYEAAPSR